MTQTRRTRRRVAAAPDHTVDFSPEAAPTVSHGETASVGSGLDITIGTPAEGTGDDVSFGLLGSTELVLVAPDGSQCQQSTLASSFLLSFLTEDQPADGGDLGHHVPGGEPSGYTRCYVPTDTGEALAAWQN